MPARDPDLVLHLPTRWAKGAAAAAVPAVPAAAVDSGRTLITDKGAQGLHRRFFSIAGVIKGLPREALFFSPSVSPDLIRDFRC